uniref:Uncharacterized protein n=1 Tax=Lactuca sativa TaxID=4236 RepID=A0A9R1XJ78_LACSA|nr:hypothetical protein LSAT_V11C300132380 [Lactuca sativa]
MGSWSIENSKNLIRILRCFKLSSGLTMSMSKSKLFGFDVQSYHLNLEAPSFNYSIGSLPFIYLGLTVEGIYGKNYALESKIFKRSYQNRKQTLCRLAVA